MKTFMDEYLGVLKKYFEFSGRAGRREYWVYTLINILILAGIGLLASLVGGASGNLIKQVQNLYSLVVFIPSLAVAIRRLHDTNRSGWWLLLSFVPLVGPIVLIVLMLLSSQPEDNKYGPNPHGTTSSPVVADSMKI